MRNPNVNNMMKSIETKTGSSKGRLFLVFLGLLSMMGMAGCASGIPNAPAAPIVSEEPDTYDTGIIVTNPNSYDSADTALLVGRDSENATLTFLNTTVHKKYTLSYDGTTKFYDKYGESLSLDQIEKGTLVDVKFLKSKKHLTNLTLSGVSWNLDSVESYEVNTEKKEVTIGKEVYKLSEDVMIVSDGRELDPMELNPVDVLCFEGIDRTVYSVKVKKGHGYLRLQNDENFVGGWIEIGQTRIQKITEDMLITLPEGTYPIDISYNGSGGTKQATIESNKETTLDIGDLEIVAPSMGTVLFSLTPSNAKLFIDGTETDASLPVSLEYGLHQLMVKKEGYKSITQYIRVGQASAGIDIVLDAVTEGEDEEDDEEITDSPSTENQVTDTSADYYRVMINAPEGAEVYVDSNYVGIAPCSFKKTEGSHVVTLRRNGYETKSYTIQVDNEQKDISYSFADLTMEGLSDPLSIDNLTQQVFDNILN